MSPAAWGAVRSGTRDRLGAALFRLGVTRPARQAAGLLTVVTFHRVLPASSAREYPLGKLAVAVEDFEWLLEFFLAHYTCETLAAAHRRWSAGERPARPLLALTFDDGERDNFEHAHPLLARHGIPATFFVPADPPSAGSSLWHDRLAWAVLALLWREPGAARALLLRLGVDAAGDARAVAGRAVTRAKALDEAARLGVIAEAERACDGPVRPTWDGPMTWGEVRALAAAGHEIGSHSGSHPLLTGLEDAALAREVAGSRARIEAELGRPCTSFCYPNGTCDARVVEAVRRAGYERAVTTAFGPNDRGADALRLARCDLPGPAFRDAGGRRSPALLALKLGRWYAGWRR